MIRQIFEFLLNQVLPPIIGFLLAFFFGGKLRRFWRILQIRFLNRRIPLDIYVSSREIIEKLDNVLNSLEKKFGTYRFRETEVSGGTSPARDKYILCNFKIEPIKSVEILLTSLPSGDDGELVVEQIKILVTTELSQYDRDAQFDTIEELVEEIRNILVDSFGCRFSQEYSLVIRVPKGREFLKFEGVRGYKFKLVDAMRKGREIRITNGEIHIYSKLDNTAQNLIYELFTIVS